MFIIMPKSRSEVKVKEKYLKTYVCPEKFSTSIVTSFSARTRESAKLHDSRTGRVILLKGWSLCTPELEQHRLSSGKNPRKSFLPFPVSAKRRRHFPRGTNLSLFRFPFPPYRLFISPPFHSPFFLFVPR